jgi:hypothetical protein
VSFDSISFTHLDSALPVVIPPMSYAQCELCSRPDHSEYYTAPSPFPYLAHVCG